MKEAIEIITELQISGIACGNQGDIVNECIDLARGFAIRNPHPEHLNAERVAQWAFNQAAHFMKAAKEFRVGADKAFKNRIGGW